MPRCQYRYCCRKNDSAHILRTVQSNISWKWTRIIVTLIARLSGHKSALPQLPFLSQNITINFIINVLIINVIVVDFQYWFLSISNLFFMI